MNDVGMDTVLVLTIELAISSLLAVVLYNEGNYLGAMFDAFISGIIFALWIAAADNTTP